MSAELVYAEGVADNDNLLPVGGNVPDAVLAIDHEFFAIGRYQRAATSGRLEVLRRELLAEAVGRAHSAIGAALDAVPREHATHRSAIEKRREGLAAFVALMQARERGASGEA